MKNIIIYISPIFFLLANSCKTSTPNAIKPSGLENVSSQNAGTELQIASQEFLEATRKDTSSDPNLDQAANDAANAVSDSNNPLNAPDAGGVIGAQISQGMEDLNKDMAISVINDGPFSERGRDSGLANSSDNASVDNSKQNASIALGVIGGFALLGSIGNYLGKDYINWNSSIKEWRKISKQQVGAEGDKKSIDDLKKTIAESSAKLQNILSENRQIAGPNASIEAVRFTKAPLTDSEKSALEKLARGEKKLTESDFNVLENVIDRQKKVYKQERIASLQADISQLIGPDFPTTKDFLDFFDKIVIGRQPISNAPQSIKNFLQFPEKITPKISSELFKKVKILAEINHYGADPLTPRIANRAGVVTPAIGMLGIFSGQMPSEREVNPLENLIEILEISEPERFNVILEKSGLEPAEKSILKKLAMAAGDQRKRIIQIMLAEEYTKEQAADALAKEFGNLTPAEKNALKTLNLDRQLVIYQIELSPKNKPILDAIIEGRATIEANAKGNIAALAANKLTLQALTRVKIEEKLRENAGLLKKISDYDKTIKATSGFGIVIGTTLLITAIGIAAASQTTSLAETSNSYAGMHSYEEKANHYKYVILPAICKKHFPDFCSIK